MAISEEQLARWANAPSPTEMKRIQKTKDDIIEAVVKNFPRERVKTEHKFLAFKLDPYLQGSYRNSTNIRFDSDVDVVVQLNTVFEADTSQLTADELVRYAIDHRKTSYAFTAFKKDVYESLQQAFGDAVQLDDKCLRIAATDSRAKADVVPAFQYRLYKRYLSLANQSFVEGLCFWNAATGEMIINFPKKHLENCESKNVDTSGKFKDMVRIFKNLKAILAEKGLLDPQTAPSYFIENYLYNCSSPCFDGNYSECIIKTIQFLFDAHSSGRVNGFICANEQDSLFGGKQWNAVNAQSFLLKLADYYLKN